MSAPTPPGSRGPSAPWTPLCGRICSAAATLGRDTAAAIERAGFSIGRLDRFLFPGTRTPVSFHITGHARKRPGGQPA